MNKFNLPVMTLMSGTLSEERSTVLALRSKASRNILFLVAEPHNLYKPATIFFLFIAIG